MSGKTQFIEACQSNDLDKCKDLFARSVVTLNGDLIFAIGLELCLINNCNDVCDWIIDINKGNKKINFTALMLKAIRTGNTQLYKAYNEKFPNNDKYEYSIRLAIKHDQYDFCFWILTEYKLSNEILNDLFNSMCMSGHLKLVQWMYEHCTIDINYNNALTLAGINGHIETCKWLLTIKPSLNIRTNNDTIFTDACGNGHMEMGKWLLEYDPAFNNFDTMTRAFRYSCIGFSSMNYNICMWLLELCPDIVITDEIFNNACEYDNMNISRKLYEINPSINTNNNNCFAFRTACTNNNKTMCEWLYKTDPNMNFNMIYRLLENHDLSSEVCEYLKLIDPDFEYEDYYGECKVIIKLKTIVRECSFNDKCSICLEEPNCILPCNHELCYDCANKVIDCPLCRKPFSFCYSSK